MKPEDFRADAKRPLTGEEYLKSLQDGREIYIYGERVKDVTTHPAFRNAAASVAQLYDALHKPEMQDSLCWGTDTGSGGYTHKFFRVAKSADDLRQQRDAIAEWSRLSYGWMGRTPDYKAAFGCALGANPAFYGQFEQNARNWYTRIQETGLYFNHAIVNPPIDRHKPADEVKDVYIKLEKRDRCRDHRQRRESGRHQLGADPLQHDRLRLRTGDGREPRLRADVRRADGCRRRQAYLPRLL